MSQKSLSRWLKAVIVGLALCGLVVFGVIIPIVGQSIVVSAPEFGYCFWPWLIFAWVAALPCYGMLILGWKVAANIGADRSFSLENARLLKGVALLAGLDSALVFIVNAIFLLLNMNHPGVAILMLLAVFAGVAVSIAAACLSHLVRKAADLQAESDLTI